MVDLIGAWTFRPTDERRDRGGQGGLPRRQRLRLRLAGDAAHDRRRGLRPARHLARHADRPRHGAAAGAPARLQRARGAGRPPGPDRRRRRRPCSARRPARRARCCARSTATVTRQEPRHVGRPVAGAPARHAARASRPPRSRRPSAGTSTRARSLFIAELPASDGVPSEAELLALGRAAVEVTPDKVAEVARATALLTTLPKGGAVVESRDACRERRDVDVARQWRARPPPAHGRAQERGEHHDHAGRRDRSRRRRRTAASPRRRCAPGTARRRVPCPARRSAT